MQIEERFLQWLKENQLDVNFWEENLKMSKKVIEQYAVAVALLYKEHNCFEEACEWLEQAVLLDDVNAMYELGNVYFELDDEIRAFQMYKQAAQRGHADAMNNLADMYLNGEGTAIDEGVALKWFTLAANEGVAEAMFTLGMMYEQGLGTAIDTSQAMHYYEKSAQHQDVEALYRLGMINLEGQLGVRPNYEQAMHYFQLAAEQFHVDALFNLAYLAEQEGDLKQAVHYYKQASLVGDIEATKKLIAYYEQVDASQVQKWQARLTTIVQEQQ